MPKTEPDWPTIPAYNDLSDDDRGRVMDGADALEALRGQGVTVIIKPDGRNLKFTGAEGLTPPERAKVRSLLDVIYYVLRLEEARAPIAEHCRTCGAPVDAYTPAGYAYCTGHYRVAKARHLLRAVDVILAAKAKEREGA